MITYLFSTLLISIKLFVSSFELINIHYFQPFTFEVGLDWLLTILHFATQLLVAKLFRKD